MGSQNAFFIGLDGGGSSCRARIRDAEGHMLGEARGGPSNIFQNFDGAIATLVATAEEAALQAGLMTTQLHAGLGLAGVVTSVSTERIIEANLPFASVAVDNDAYAACLGAFSGEDGGIVIAGTGSIAFGLRKGQRHMIGGWGFALGDHGSGSWLGHHAVRRTALAIDGLLQPTPLIEVIQEKLGRTRHDISSWSATATPRDYGQFSPLIFERAAQGDVQAMIIVIEGASAISQLGRALVARGMRKIALLGGLSKAYPPYLDADVKAALVEPLADACDGAILMARQAQT